MAEVECITLDEDEEHDLLPGAGRNANHPQMVWSQLVRISQSLPALCAGAVHYVC